MNTISIILLILIIILVRIFISYWFGQIAEMKGHKFMKYYLICLFFGLIGYLMIIALPDRANNK